MAETKRKTLEILWGALETERATFIPHYRDIADLILPRRPQWLTTDTNRGDKSKYNQKILDETGALAARVLSAGMMAGLTSPARPWKRLTTHDAQLAEYGPVKDWLHAVDTRMSSIFSRSNLYNSLSQLYGDAGVFGTSPMVIEEDFDDVIRTYTFPVGSYMLALNDKLKVDVFAREFKLTIRQVIQKFGRYNEKSGSPDWSVFSTRVKSAYDNSRYDEWVDVNHVIRPNMEYNPSQLRSKKYESLIWEKGFPDSPSEGRFLREAGYGYFPILAGRWETTGEDVYGTNCPGMMALGSVKQLQVGEKRILQAIEKMVNPPLAGPETLRRSKVSLLPGDITYYDERDGIKGLRAIHEVRFDVTSAEDKQRQKREVVNECFFRNLFLMFTGIDRKNITAAEIYARQEEKLILGSVLEQLNQDVYDPLIDITFNIMASQGLIPEPPPELEGEDLKVEYISIMHQAMKVAGLSSIDRLTGYVGQMAALNPEVMDKFDADQAIDEYAEILGTPPRIVRPDDAVLEIRGQRAQAAAAQQKSLELAEGAKTAKDFASTDMAGDNGLTRLVQAAGAGALVNG